jgi:hypothetical protein
MRVAEWEDLAEGRLYGADADPMVKEALDELEQHASADPSLEGHVLEILGRQVSGGVDERTWASINKVLATLFGPKPAALFSWLAFGDAAGDPSSLDAVQAAAGPAAGSVIRLVMAAFGPDMGRAYAISKQSPHDWRIFSREVYQDRITGQPFLRVRIEKWNGEMVMLEGNGNSFLGLAKNFLILLQLIGAPDAVDPSAIQSLFSEVERLRTVLVPPPPSPSADGAEASAGVTPVVPDGDPGPSPTPAPGG